jgi:hypothetical protein
VAPLAGQGPRGPADQGPLAAAAREAARPLAIKHALAHPAWGHRKIWAMVRHDAHVVSEATVLRLLRDDESTFLRTTSGNAVSWPSGARPRSPSTRPGRIRSGSWTSASSRRPAVGPGGWPAAGTTGASTSTPGTSHRPRTRTTRSTPSSSPWPTTSSCSAAPWSTSARSTRTPVSCCPSSQS